LSPLWRAYCRCEGEEGANPERDRDSMQEYRRPGENLRLGGAGVAAGCERRANSKES